MNVKRGIRRIGIVITVITVPLIFFGLLITYSGFRTVDNLNRNLVLHYPNPNKQAAENLSNLTGLTPIRTMDGKTKFVPSQETSRNEVLFGIKEARQFRNFGLILLGLSSALFALFFIGKWIFAGFNDG